MFLRQLQIYVYIGIASVGLVGNLLTIAILLRRKNRHKTNSILLMNLALADTMVCGVCLPVDLGQHIAGQWIYGKILCPIIQPFETSLIMVTGWTFMFMMLERNLIISLTMGGLLKRKTLRMFVAITWIVSFVLVVPNALKLNYTLINGTAECQEVWGKVVYRHLYTVALFVVEYLIPMGIAVGFMINMVINIHAQSNAVQTNLLGLDKKTLTKRLKANRKLTTIFTTMVALYAVLKLPNNIFWLWLEFDGRADSEVKFVIWTFSGLSSYSTSMTNPFILTAMSTEFRKDLRNLRRCFCCKYMQSPNKTGDNRGQRQHSVSPWSWSTNSSPLITRSTALRISATSFLEMIEQHRPYEMYHGQSKRKHEQIEGKIKKIVASPHLKNLHDNNFEETPFTNQGAPTSSGRIIRL